MKKILFIITTTLFVVSCSKDNDDTGTNQALVTFDFYHHWDGTEVTKNQFDLFEYTNANGDLLSINHLRYLISDIRFIREDGSYLTYTGFSHALINIEKEFVNGQTPSHHIPQGTYKGVVFTFGFDEENNISGAYPDLNSESWNWPENIGGGYHYLQLEGKYINDIGVDMPYAYHMGPTMDDNEVRDNNHFVVTHMQEFVVTDYFQLTFKMNLAEWFKNPHTWNLNTYDVNLMMNFEAQKMMQANGQDVFEISIN